MLDLLHLDLLDEAEADVPLRAVHEGRIMSAGIEDEWLRKWKEYFLAWYDEGKVDEKVREAIDFATPYLR